MEEDNKEVKTIDSNDWQNLSFLELLEQKNILFDRYEFLRSKGYPYASTLIPALHKIEDIMQTKI
jgi:hypothetical protein